MKKLVLTVVLGMGLGLGMFVPAQAQYYCPPQQPYSYNYWWYRDARGYTYGSYNYRTAPTPYQPVPRTGSSWWFTW
jgi:hypothetical protein